MRLKLTILIIILLVLSRGGREAEGEAEAERGKEKMAVKVYGMPMTTNTIRVLAALNEKGLEYELVTVDINRGDHRRPSFLKLNPFGLIPVLEDGDVVIYESRAINRYIARKYKDVGPDLLCSAGTPAEQAAVEMWQEVEAQHFNPPAVPLVVEALIKPTFGGFSNPSVVEGTARELGKVLDVYEARLAQSKYLAGGEFTLADLNMMPYVNYLMKTQKKSLVTSRPHLLAWWNDISSRPGWKKTAAGIGMFQFDQAPDLQSFFGFFSTNSSRAMIYRSFAIAAVAVFLYVYWLPKQQ